jgi:hypothetical protein
LSDKTVVTLTMGSPQGEILSPFCGWNCAMSKLLIRLKKTKTHCKAFADDGALISCNKKLSEAMNYAQKAINVAMEWANEMGVEFSVEKAVVMLLTKKRARSYKMPMKLQLYGKESPFSKTTKYLGITIDNKLSLKPHKENF